MEITMKQNTISTNDIESLGALLHSYFSRKNTCFHKVIMNFNLTTWMSTLSGLTNDELVNGINNLKILIQKNQETHVIQFPVSATIFRKLCKTT